MKHFMKKRMSTGPAPTPNLLGGSSGAYIYGVVSVPNTLTTAQNTSVCPASGNTCPVVYHCSNGKYRASDAPCQPGYWAFTDYGDGEGQDCILPYYQQNQGAYTDTSPTPYNWMAGLTNPRANTISGTTLIPTLGGVYLPHLIASDPNAPQTGLSGNAFADFVDNTANTANTGCSAPASMVVAYQSKWFVTGNTVTDIQNISAFLSNSAFQNLGTDPTDPTSIYTYNNLVIPSIQYQIYNFILAGQTVNFCGRTATTATCTNGQTTCSNYYAATPSTIPNICSTDVLNSVFGSAAGSSALTSILAASYSESASQYCTNAVFANPDSSGNTGPAECFCVNQEYSALYNELNSTQNPALEKLQPGCWWSPCNSIKTSLPLVAQWNQTCTAPICENIIEAVGGGTIKNQGQIKQYVNCTTSNSGTPQPASDNHWITIVAVVVIFIVVILLVIFIAAKARGTDSREPTEKPKEKSNPKAQKNTKNVEAPVSVA